MDVFMEELLRKKKEKKEYIISACFILLGLILSVFVVLLNLWAMLVLKKQITQMIVTFGPIMLFGIWYGVYRLINRQSVEYEYIVINSNVDIDKVMSKKTRKRLISFDVKDAKLMACIDDEDFNSSYKNPPSNTKILNYSAMNKNLNTYFVDCVIENERKIILFQPTSKMVEALWKFNPKAVKRYNS